MRKIGVTAAAAWLLAATPVFANPVGDWVAESGDTRLQITRCGDAFCGVPAGSGSTIAFNLRDEGAGRWVGPAVNLADGETHVVSMTFAGNSRMVIRGCLRLLCIEQAWQRANARTAFAEPALLRDDHRGPDADAAE